MLITNCILSANTCDAYLGIGGAVYNAGMLKLVSTTVGGGSYAVYGDGGGGGFAVYGGGLANAATLQLVNSTVSQNNASLAGAGIYNTGILLATNTTVSHNLAASAYGSGAGIFNDGGHLWLDSCTVADNKVGSLPSGGGVLVAGGSLYARNSIIADNTAGGGGPDVSGAIISQDFNVVGNTNGASITGVTTHNIYGKDPLLGPLADNGGPTWTHALLPGSPAIDQGSSGGLTTDQRGQPRPFDFPAYFNADDGSDIGAYELQERAQTGPVFTVNSNDDVDDGVPGIAHCSLREAINAANANPGTNTIDFAAEVPGLHTGVTGTITLTGGQLTITNSVNIAGPGAANLTVSGNNASRVFYLPTASSTVRISDLTTANGNAGTGDGGGILNGATLTLSRCIISSNSASAGGGIVNFSSNTITESTISGNRATNNSGGGIYNNGQMSITSSTISSNYTLYNGGGLNLGYVGSTLQLTNCTVSGNIANVAGGGISFAGSLELSHCTVASNRAAQGGGAVHGDPFSSPVFQGGNSIIAGNTGEVEFRPYLLSEDFNLIQNTNGCVIIGSTTHNIYNQDPKLGPLAYLGGPTPTHALRFDSPAIDAGNSGGLTTDQRGFPRPIDDPNVANAEGGDGSDIGAYEADPNLRISGLGKAGADIWLSFNSMWGKTYRVESTDKLPPTWAVLTNNVPGTGGRLQALDEGAANLAQRFYRTVLLP